MTGAWTRIALALSALGGSFSWPGALETDGRAVADLPEAERPAGSTRWPSGDAQRLQAIDRLVAAHGVDAAMPFLLPLLADREPIVRLYAARLAARAGAPAAEAAAISWIVSPAIPAVDRAFGLDVLGHVATLSRAARAVVEQAARDPDAGIRVHALETLERHPIGPSLSVVLGALDDDNREARSRAVRLVGTIRDPRAALPLLDRLEDSDRQIRLQTITALGLLGDPRVVPALLRLVGEGTMDERAAAIDALGTLEAPAAVSPLIALARRRTDDLARHALLALGEIATPAATDALVAALRTPPIPDEAPLGLRHAGQAAVPALIREVARGGATAALAATLLGEIGDRRATAPICAAFEGGADGPPIGPAALDALARLADPAAVPTLTRLAESPDAEIRQRAFAALLSIGDPRSVAVLDAGLIDPDARVRVLAARLAGTTDARGAFAALAARIADSAPAVRRAAAEALARIARPSMRSVAQVLTALTQADATARDDDETDAIGDALEAVASEGDADALARAFATARPWARGAIARGLAAAHIGQPISDGALIDRLIAALADGGLTALAVADALAGARIPAAAVPALARAFGDAEPMVRARLCPAVASTPEGGGWLAALIGGPDEAPEVRAAAAWSARGHPEARGALEAAARGGDGALARNAEAALTAAAHPGAAWAAVRLRAPDDAPLVGRWVTIEDAAGVAIQAMTDSRGVARVTGLAGDRLDLRAAGLTLRAEP